MQHKPRKRFGQNFLIDQQIIQRIVSAINPKPNQCIVEIGPGLGALSVGLLAHIPHLLGIELDRDVIPKLAETVKSLGKMHIIQGDALQIDFQTLCPENQKLRIVGNLPYNISTPLIFHLLTYSQCIQDMHFMLQKEVVERLNAPINSKAYGRLSVMIQYHCEVEACFVVSPNAFNPPPKVDSMVVRIKPRQSIENIANDYELFSILVREAFNQRRKTLRNSLRAYLDEKNDFPVDLSLRAEQLSVADYV